MSEYQLTKEIMALSNAKAWDAAKSEWVLEDVYVAEKSVTCLCGHFPIIEICMLRNVVNRNTAMVGNCCVKNFIGLPSDNIFQAVKRVRKDIDKSLSAEAVQHAVDRGWITDWEKDFYFDIMRKRNLSTKQAAMKAQINEKFMRNMQRKK